MSVVSQRSHRFKIKKNYFLIKTSDECIKNRAFKFRLLLAFLAFTSTILAGCLSFLRYFCLLNGIRQYARRCWFRHFFLLVGAIFFLLLLIFTFDQRYQGIAATLKLNRCSSFQEPIETKLRCRPGQQNFFWSKNQIIKNVHRVNQHLPDSYS